MGCCQSSSSSHGNSGSSTLAYPAAPATDAAVAPPAPPPASSQSATTSSGTSATSSSSVISHPGAYMITPDPAGPTQDYQIQIPHDIGPGQEFYVVAGHCMFPLRCPAESRGGDNLRIQVPMSDPVMRREALGMAVLTCALPGAEGGGGAVRMSDDVARLNSFREEEQMQPQQYQVTVPAGIFPGMQFMVNIEGQNMMVTCPANVQAGMNWILPPVLTPSSPLTSLDRPPPEEHRSPTGPPMSQFMQTYDVVVPPGVRPNQPFSLIANGQRVLVTCPPNVRPGMTLRFQLPLLGNNDDPAAKDEGGKKPPPAVQLEYESIKDGWARTIRVKDMRFVWVRMNEDGDIDPRPDDRFDVRHSAYTRKITFLEGNDKRMRTGTLSLVPANESSVESSVACASGVGPEVVGYAEIAAAHQRGSFDEKAAWFQEICRERLHAKWTDGHVRLIVRRWALLRDSMEAVMSLGRDDLRKYWRFEFMGEIGIDAGGLAREWFQLVSEEIFNPDMGLWLPSASNQMAMRINPASEISCPEDHLIYFRFWGRVMGKALFDGHLVAGHMVRHMYKHILGWPVMFEDLKLPDEEYYNSLKSSLEVENVDDLCVDFTFTENALGENRVVELMEGGKDVPVTNQNLPEFLEANLKYHLMDRVKPQLTELLLGFYDVIPESLLTIFDFQELELLMCGVPVIDIDDWMANTSYLGLFQQEGANSKTCQWFWEVVREEFNQETRARLLQFVTGTSGVPSRGFSVLQGNDGTIRLFCINGIRKEESFYPRSHTCFNRLDLPVYDSKEELRDKLKVSIATSATGFDIQ
ncbi:hypothetical protein ACHAW5_007959 [Stephanodiscus triporus]|uniref:HECT-type E3 ubiquitin transferase n=1 Tax=Stephanodiscus triporus TaxID=2934178 RepID=A0ABD3NG31_9STRA